MSPYRRKPQRTEDGKPQRAKDGVRKGCRTFISRSHARPKIVMAVGGSFRVAIRM